MTLLRSNLTQKLAGGISCVTSAIVKLFFGHRGHDMSKAGVHVRLVGGDTMHIMASLGIVIADEAALHMMYMCKGSGGLKPCMLCANIFNDSNERDVLKHDHTGLAQSHTCPDFNKIVLHTNATVRETIRRLEEGARHLTKGAFEELERRLGWNYTPGSLVLEPRILDICDPVRVVLYDWMHVFFVNGVFNAHVGLLMRRLKPHGITYDMLKQYTEPWKAPKQFTDANEVLSTKRAQSSWKAEVLKASASESLSLMPVFACFFHVLSTTSSVAEVLDHSRCFLGLIDVIETIMKSARVPVDCDALQRSIGAYLGAFAALYGPDEMTPKFHYVIHFPSFIRRWQILPNCFVLERKHKFPKRYANALLNTAADWEKSILKEVTNVQLASLADTVAFDDGAALLAPHIASKKLNRVLQHEFNVEPNVVFMTSTAARINEWDKCSLGDVVSLHDGRVGRVALHGAYQHNGEWVCFSSLWMWEHVAEHGRYMTWRPSNTPLICLISEIKCAVVWAEANDMRRTLKPLYS